MSNLYHASRQWATRPADQRFWTLAEMLQAVDHYRDSARTAVAPLASLQAVPDGDELLIQGKAGTPARLTHWSMGQLARTVGAPAEYLRGLPADLAAANVNHGLASRPASDSANLLIHRNGSLVLRSLTSDSYTRIWDADVVKRCLELECFGWRVPPARPAIANDPSARPATEADCLADRTHGLSVKPGDLIAPAGLYASDHDCFIFMVSESRLRDGTEGGLSRGFFLSNSEVGAAALKLTTFLYRHVCGNHIVWGAEGVKDLRIVHRGKADSRWSRQLAAEIRIYADASAANDEARIVAAQRLTLGADKDAVLAALFARLRGDLPAKTLGLAYDRAALDSSSDRTIDPRTVWGMVQGITAMSQDTPHTDERVRLDRAAGKVLQMAF